MDYFPILIFGIPSITLLAKSVASTENDNDLKMIQSFQFLDKFTKLPASSRDALIQFLDTLE